jgi:hypothetical protein
MAKEIEGMSNLLYRQMVEIGADRLNSPREKREKIIRAIQEALESAFSFGKLER